MDKALTLMRSIALIIAVIAGLMDRYDMASYALIWMFWADWKGSQND